MSKGIPLKGKAQASLPKFNIIKHLGTLGDATTHSGKKIARRDALFMPSFTRLIKCAPYDNHFIYRVPNSDSVIGASTIMCTCGSMAVVTGHDAYKNDGSPQGELILCHWHATIGRHADGGQ